MKTRCYNKNRKDYPNYGGRGIGVTKEWVAFEGFEKDMSPTYKEGLTLDRIDNNKGYTKENCRWVTRTVQNNNRRNNKHLSFNGKNLTMSEWAKELGIKRSTIGQRYYTYNWSVNDCLSK